MKPTLCPYLLALALAFTARFALAAPPAASTNVPTPPASAVASPIPTLPTRPGIDAEKNFFYPPPLLLQKDISYDEARTKLLAQGWRPIHNPYCVINILLASFGGDDFNHYKGTCKPGKEAEACQTCSAFPEIKGCTGDGHCWVTFSYGDKWLQIGLEIGGFDNNGFRESSVMDWGLMVVTPWQPQPHQKAKRKTQNAPYK
jgi:hypothetical protein